MLKNTNDGNLASVVTTGVTVMSAMSLTSETAIDAVSIAALNAVPRLASLLRPGSDMV